jgi:DUF917 family protein
MKHLSIEDMENIVWGATLLGAGGGGSPENGLQLLKEIKKITNEVTLLEAEDIEEDKHIATVAGMGAQLSLKEHGFNLEAINAFETLVYLYKMAGVTIDLLMPVETGGFNSIVPLYVAAYKKIPVADFDGAGGRAVPELNTLLYQLYNLPSSPLTLANREGDSIAVWLKDSLNIKMGEEIGRHITVAFGMLAGLAGWTLTGWQVKKYMEPKSLTNALTVGQAIKEARLSKKDTIRAAVEALGGYELFRGIIQSIDVKTVEGFDFGRTTLEGIDEYSGKNFYIDFKNENMIAWREKNKPAAMVPDSICLMTLDGTPLTNADIKEKMKIGVIGFPAGERWRSAPEFFNAWTHILTMIGYSENYIPLEKLI